MDLKQYFFVIRELTGRELKRKYARSYLGVIWSVLNPLLSMAILSLIFSAMFERSIENFPIYLLTGRILWGLFTGASNAAMDSLVSNKSLLLRTRLPKMIFPLSRVYTAVVNFGYSLIAYAGMLLVFRIKPSLPMVAIPVIVLLLVLFSTGLGLLLSIIYVNFADISYLYNVILTLWMYLSALFYPVSMLSPEMQAVVNNNPVYSYIAAMRGCVLQGEWPSPLLWLQMSVWALVMFGIGMWVFNANSNKIMQNI